MKENNIIGIEQFINKLEALDRTLGCKYPPATDKDIWISEKHIGYSLPIEYKHFLHLHNGILFRGEYLLGVGSDYKPKGMSLNYIYDIEHELSDNSMPKHLIPICPDGFGNHYCYDLHRNNKIVFWQHDYEYSEYDCPEIVYQSLSELIQEVFIDWSHIEESTDDKIV